MHNVLAITHYFGSKNVLHNCSFFVAVNLQETLTLAYHMHVTITSLLNNISISE